MSLWVVEFHVTSARVSEASLSGFDPGQHQPLDRLGDEFHRVLTEVASLGCVPLVMLLDEDMPGEAD